MNESTQQGQKIFTIGGILLLLIALLIGISYLAPSKAIEVAADLEISLPNPYDDITLSAQAALVYDLNTQEILFGIEEETQLPLASLTKLLSTYLATKELGENRYIRITSEDLRTEGDSGLFVSEVWKVGDLARYTLISSSNDGAHALTRALSTQSGKTPALFLSQAAAALALPQTFALNGSGLDTSTQMSGAYGSAYDIAVLLGVIYKENRDLLLDSSSATAVFTSADGFTHEAKSTNSLADTLPLLVGAKTGYTDLAGGNLAVLVEVAPGRPIAIVVLSSTREGRFTDVETLVEKTLQHFTYNPVF
ncbi:D-alanyl-D-alanine carboxypeptidase [Candidatus Wolfebacteria bacterium]|nr:D-alanyl-D-alanine carboxypeptidase [Candidatus Wolfebacteria bacterium]